MAGRGPPASKLLLAPVRPTNPAIEPAATLRSTASSASGRPSRYRMLNPAPHGSCSQLNRPRVNHDALGDPWVVSHPPPHVPAPPGHPPSPSAAQQAAPGVGAACRRTTCGFFGSRFWRFATAAVGVLGRGGQFLSPEGRPDLYGELSSLRRGLLRL